VRAFPNELAPTRVPIIIPSDKLAAVVDFWVAWLGLTGWTHQIQLTTAKDFGSLSQTGAAWWELARRHFNVAILDQEEVGPEESYDQEETLVHELLHVCFAAWTDESFPGGKREGTLFNLCVEQPLDRVASALTVLGRAHPSHPLQKRAKARRK
jgi:hypothetical protein